MKTEYLVIIAIAALLGITFLANGQKNDEEMISGGGGGGWAAFGDDSGNWLDGLLTGFQQEQPQFENPFQDTAEQSGNSWFYLDTFANLTGFATADDPLFKAGILETQLQGGLPDGMYSVSVPYAPTAAGAQAQINNTINAPTPSKSGGSRGGKGFGSAKIVNPVSNAVNDFKKTISNLSGTGNIGKGFGGGSGGAR